jgi:hypothetical protein
MLPPHILQVQVPAGSTAALLASSNTMDNLNQQLASKVWQNYMCMHALSHACLPPDHCHGHHYCCSAAVALNIHLYCFQVEQPTVSYNLMSFISEKNST